MIAVELVRSGTDEPAPDLAKAVASAAHQRGVIVLTCGTFGNVLRFLPPSRSVTTCSPTRSTSSPTFSRRPDDRHSRHPPDTTAATRSPLDDARSQLADAIKVLGYDQGMYDLLAAPRRELTVSIPLRRDDGSVEIITGHRVQHNYSRGPAKGGLRFSPHATSTRSARWPCG